MELNQDLVEEGKALVGLCESSERMTCEARFQLGRWVSKVAPQQFGNNQHTSTATTVGELLRIYADAVGCSPKTLEQYRDIVIAWGDEEPSGLSWTVARKLAYRSDKVQLINAVFQMFGKVTPKTIEDYEAHLREENARREALLQQTSEEEEVEWEEEWVEEEIEVISTTSDPTTSNPTPRKHGFSAPIRRLFSVVEHVRSAKALFDEEHVPTVDVHNDENYEEIMGAFDTIITEMMAYREALMEMRVKAGLSPEL